MERVESLVDLHEETESDSPTFFDISDTLKTIPPIDREFDPGREVRGILKLPTSERREALVEFKDKLARQREAWAACRVALEDQIELYPDTPEEALQENLHEFARNYGFASHHVKIAEGLIGNYADIRNRLLQFRERYPNDAELIKRALGVRFSSADMQDIEVETGSISLEITCSGFNAGRLYERSQNPVTVYRYGGFATRSGGHNYIYITVVNRDYESANPGYFASTFPHEREHHTNDMLRSVMPGNLSVNPLLRNRLNSGVKGFFRHHIYEELLGLDRSFAMEALQAYENAKDPDEKRYFLTEYMRMVRDFALSKAKDELLAMEAEKKTHFYRNDEDMVVIFAPGFS